MTIGIIDRDVSKTNSKKISGAAYVAYSADLASRGEGVEGATMAALTFQCALVQGTRTVEEWDALVVKAHEAEVTPAEAAEYDEG